MNQRSEILWLSSGRHKKLFQRNRGSAVDLGRYQAEAGADVQPEINHDMDDIDSYILMP